MAVKTNSGVAILPHLEHVKAVVDLLARHTVFCETFSPPLLLVVFLHIVITHFYCVSPGISVCGSNFPRVCVYAKVPGGLSCICP